VALKIETNYKQNYRSQTHTLSSNSTTRILPTILANNFDSGKTHHYLMA